VQATSSKLFNDNRFPFTNVIKYHLQICKDWEKLVKIVTEKSIQISTIHLSRNSFFLRAHSSPSLLWFSGEEVNKSILVQWKLRKVRKTGSQCFYLLLASSVEKRWRATLGFNSELREWCTICGKIWFCKYSKRPGTEHNNLGAK